MGVRGRHTTTSSPRGSRRRTGLVLRPARQRGQHAPSGPRGRLLDGRPLRPGADNLVDSGIADRYDVLGQSWGGFLAQEYAFTQPPGLHSLVSPTRPRRFRLRRRGEPAASCCRRRRGDAAPARGRRDDRRPRVHGGGPRLLRTSPLQDRPAARAGVGLRADRSRSDRLSHDERPEGVPRHRLDPRLAGQGPARRDRRADAARLGRHDEATPALQQVLLDGIAGSEWVCFEESSHMPHVEERGRYMQVVGDWLARYD